jgi:alpha-beta hydrolase superfamily lysophospholipase
VSDDVLTFTDPDGVEVGYRRWLPDGEARAIVHISHGASEHAGRYDRFARCLTTAGYAVYAHDHRGHGTTSVSTGVGRAGPRGWHGLVDNLGHVGERARADLGGLPFILFAHSMGSIAGQLYAQEHSRELAGLVLSGSFGAIDDLEATIAGLEAFVEAGGGGEPAPLFDAFNEPFAPARTDFDWLSRDPDEVDRYVADPWCGSDHPLTLGFALEMLRACDRAWDPANEARIRPDLPVLIISGEHDPVSDATRTVRDLEARYRKHGLTDVTASYYPDARHELLNETNRDEVHAHLLAWLDRVAAPA